MQQEFSNVSAPPKKKNTVIIIVAVIVALLCCCCLLIAGGFAFFGPIVSNTFERIEEGFYEEFPFNEMPYFEDGEWDYGDGESYPEDGEYDFSGFLSDYVPSGGLGDDTLRFDTWLNISFSAAFSNCIIPEDGASKTVIEVVEYPDGNGVWVERWTAPCEGGGEKSFLITFAPAEDGGTDISIQGDD
jgi:hypothetical protein